MRSKTIFALSVIVICASLLCISCKPSEKNYCSSTDKRFKCTGYLGLDDNYIVFSDVPTGVYTLQKPYLEYEDKKTPGGAPYSVECTGVVKESGDYTGIMKDRKYYFDCIPKTAGRYTMDMKIMHSEPQSYQPVSGETCLLMGQGYQNKWECTASAYYSITVIS